MFLSLENLTFTYPGAETPIFRNVNFQLSAPGFHALFGPSGVGKTSFAKIIAGDLPSPEGQVHIDPHAVILYTYNQERLPGWAPIRHFIDSVTPPDMMVMKERLIDIFGMAECLDLKFSQLSLGQKNRVNLIRYLLQPFDLLIMDESLANVDERSRQTIIPWIKKTFPDRFFLYISHHLMEVATFGDSICILRDTDKPQQARQITGMNLGGNHTPDKERLDGVLLEIMNAY